VSASDAAAFLQRAESDEYFAKQLALVRADPDAVLERIHAAGFDATSDEISDAVAERYGTQLSPEQLQQLAGGVDDGTLASEAVQFGIIGGVSVGIAAVVAAAGF
jgi:predicted ribosomally synthesized peptide with nif11-like leader